MEKKKTCIALSLGLALPFFVLTIYYSLPCIRQLQFSLLTYTILAKFAILLVIESSLLSCAFKLEKSVLLSLKFAY